MYSRIFVFKQKTAYEMRISDWSSDVCSSDLPGVRRAADRRLASIKDHPHGQPGPLQGRWRGDEKHGRFSIDRHLEMTAEAGGIQFDAHFGKRDVDTIDNVSDQRLDEPISTVTQQSCQLLCFFDERWNVVFIRR